MTDIKNLTQVNELSAGDLVPIYTTQNGATRKASAAAFVNAIGDSYVEQAEAQANAATLTVSAFQNLVYPGVYGLDPTTRPNGSAIQEGDRAVVLVGGLPTEKLRSGGLWIVPNVDAVNIAAPSGSSLVGFLQAGTGAVAITQQAKGRQFAHVMEFGAVGDGVADDSDEIENALNSGAGTVLFTQGAQYKITRALAVEVSNLTIEGRGASVVQTTAYASGLILGQTLGGSYVKVENINVVGLKMTGADDGVGSTAGFGITVRSPATDPYVQFDGCNNIRVIACEFTGWAASCVGTAVTGLHFHGNTSKDTFYYGSLNAGGYGLLAQTCFDVNATDNKFLSVAKSAPLVTTDRHAFYISADPTRAISSDNVCKGVYLAGNSIDWSNTHPVSGFEVCIALRGTFNIRIEGNYLQGGVQGIVYNSENAAGNNIIIAGNNISDINSPASEGGPINVYQGVGSNITTNVSITGNTLTYTGAQAHGIQVRYADRVLVGGNVVTASVSVISALSFDTNVTNLTVSQNVLTGATFNRCVRFLGTGNANVTMHKQQITLSSGARYGYITVPSSLRFEFNRAFSITSNGAGTVAVNAGGNENPATAVVSDANGFTVTFDGSVDVNGIGFTALSQSASVGNIYKRTTGVNTVTFGVLDFAGVAMPAASNAYTITVSLPG